MERFAHLGLAPADILLPNCNLSKWSVIACDQFTAQPDYWRRVEERVGDSPSSLRLILPEARLHGDNETAGAERIHAAMQRYLEQNLFYACPDSMVYVERAVSGGVRHGLVCLLHEKPFAGVNGSGKHNNWSIATDTGVNLLTPGETPHENAQFLLFLCAVIQAVDDYQDLLRLSVATAGNDHRLGANEAPPAVVSMFLGDELTGILDSIEKEEPYSAAEKTVMKLGVHVLPKFIRDTTDRNRTSPFAFTGNKFEFRMPGSAQNLSDCDTILNTAVAKELKGYADELEGAEDFTSAAIALVKRTIRDHRRVIFNGNGYSAEWEEEAARRGLPNKKNAPAALPALIDPKNIALMEEFGVLTKVEMYSRYEVELEHYSKIINIEALTMLEMARKQLLPAVNSYMSELANTAASKLAVSESISVRSETKTLGRLSADADAMSDAIDTLQDAVDAAKALPSESEKAVAFHDNVLPAMDALRAAADDAETICGEDYWPLPSYSKMLYYV